MRKVGYFILGVFSILFLLVGISSIVRTPTMGFFFIVGAVILWPSMVRLISAKLNNNWQAPVAGFVCALFIGPLLHGFGASGVEKEVAIDEEARLEYEQKKAEDRTEAFRKHEEDRQRGLLAYREQLEREVKSIQAIKASNYIKDVASINRGLVLIGAWALLYEQGAALSLDDQTRKSRQDFLSAVSRKQVEMLPVLRDAYGPAMRQQLWEADGSAKTFGAGFKTIEFIASEFVRNANIKRMNDQMREVLMMLRFNQVRYKWFDRASEYTYYELSPPSDAEVVKWKGGGSFEVLR